MYVIKLNIFLVLMFFHVTDCVRRITGGSPITVDKSYVVYLVKASLSVKVYDAWLCGGAIVSSIFIISSAACVDDVEYMYAIAGYKKYVTDKVLVRDTCTKKRMKKIVYTCVPVKYELEYDKLEKWSFIDIALLKVESPYDFTDNTYKSECSYIPTAIAVNYESKYQSVDTDAMVLGWGHAEVWRKPGDTTNYNQETLHFAPTLIINKQICKKHYEMFPNMSDVIDQFMICTMGKGNLNDAGETMLQSKPTANGCQGPQKLAGEGNDEECDYKNTEDHDLVDNTRRELNEFNQTHYNDSDPRNTNSSSTLNETTNTLRNSGICQNDHGGPLVTWVGTREVLIGVASVFKVSEDSKCTGPYLYTSTQCNGAFLDCVLSQGANIDRERQALCDSPPIQRGYDTVERHISWRNHPAGPAENEIEEAKENFLGYNTPNNPKVDEKKSVDLKEKFARLDKFSEHNLFAVRPQRPLTN